MDILRHVVLVPVTWLMAALEVDRSVGFSETCQMGLGYLEEDQDSDIFGFFQVDGPTVLIALDARVRSGKDAKECFLAGLWVKHLTARKNSQTMHANHGGDSEKEGDPQSWGTVGSAGSEDSAGTGTIDVEADCADA